MLTHDNPSKHLPSILILGTGQLGLMLAREGARLGLKIDRLDIHSGEILLGTSAQRISTSISEISDNYGIISAELEHLGSSPLLNGIYSLPQWQNSSAFTALPHRAEQKALFDELKIPTAPWLAINDQDALTHARHSLGSELVVKVTEGGYDGKGQWCLFKPDSPLPPSDMFGSLIAEQRINFTKEVSILGARNSQGELGFLPLAENVHHNGILRYSLVRQSHQQYSESARSLLGTLMNALNYTGLMAMECFVTDQGLLVNEVAPRVHNSGHWSQFGCIHSQFSLHLYGLLNLSVPSQHYQDTLMLNLIGCEFDPRWLGVDGVQCHWYGKQVRPGRKLGHLNFELSALGHSGPAMLELLDHEHSQHLQDAMSQI